MTLATATSPATRPATLALLGVFASLASGLALAGWLYARHVDAQFREEASEQLEAVAELKVNELAQWRRERLGDATLFHANPSFARLVEGFLAGDAGARRHVIGSLVSLREAYGYQSALLLDAAARPVAWAPTGDGPPSVDSAAILEGMRSGQVTMLDFHHDLQSRAIHLATVAPILGGPDGRTVRGALLLRIDPHSYLYPLITRWPVPSQTGETLLVRRDGDSVEFLNELRHRPETALSLRLPAGDPGLPAALAVSGRKGVVEGTDYRGVPVLAALRPVPDSPWFLVAKLDAAEVFAPLARRMRILGVSVTLLMTVTGLALALIWNRYTARHDHERLQAAEAFAASEHRFRLLVDNVQDYAIYGLDPQGRVTSWNRGAQRLKGYAPEQILGQSWAVFFPEAERTQGHPERLLHEAAEEGRAWDEGWSLRQDGTRFWAEAVTTPLRAADGSLGGFATIAHDLTERREKDEALRHLTDVLRAVRNVNQLITHEKDPQRLLQRACEILASDRGYRAAWIATRDDAGLCQFAAASGAEASGERLRSMLGSTRWPECCGAAFGSPGVVVLREPDPGCHGCAMVAAHGDSIALACALRHAGRLHGVLVVAAPASAAGDAEEQALVAELAGDLGFALHSIQTERDRARAIAEVEWQRALLEETGRLARIGGWEFDAATRKGTWTDEVARIHGVDPGQATDVELGLSFYPEPDRERIAQAVTRAIDEARPYDLELRLLTASGQRKWVRTIGHPVVEAGRVVRVRGSIQDITEKRQAEEELRRLAAELEERVRRRTTQLESANRDLEAFAYSVSHDLRAPLRAIDGWSQALAEDCATELGPGGLGHLARVRSETRRMALLIDDLLQLSRVGRAAVQLAEVDLSTIARVVAELLVAAEPGRQVTWAIESGLMTRADPRLVEIVLTNLLGNAWKFTAGRATARIGLSRVAVGGETAFVVEDDGVGFDMKHAGRLFTPFERLHGASDFPGTGIGLAIVKRIVERHGGRVWARAEPGRGSRFFFTLGDE